MSFILNDNYQIPRIGFGTYGLKGAEGVETIRNAILQGYRLIDSAFSYENEGTVGQAIRESGINRNEIMITSKLPGRYHSYDAALLAIEESLSRAGIEAFDLYLIHWPNPFNGRYVEAWQALIKAKERGLVRSIGVSNFMCEHIERIIEATGVVPAVNQIECHPFYNQEHQRVYNASKGIVTQAWSPLGRQTGVLNHELFDELSIKYQKTPAQIVLRWATQLGVVPIPKASTPKRQKENLEIFNFALSTNDMRRINTLSYAYGRIKGQDPSTYHEY